VSTPRRVWRGSDNWPGAPTWHVSTEKRFASPMPARHAGHASVAATAFTGTPRQRCRHASYLAHRRPCREPAASQVAGLDSLPRPGSADLVLHSPSKVSGLGCWKQAPRVLCCRVLTPKPCLSALCSSCPDQPVSPCGEAQRGRLPRLGVPLPRECEAAHNTWGHRVPRPCQALVFV
jgi:hypothetical protein